ncbi:MAG: Fic family protein [Acidobacteriota bacterium]|nr:Fic family protein [Acidobacteriota bacterium]
MEPENFTDAMTGRIVPVPNGQPGAKYAFVPKPLPPDWKWPERLWPLLIEARKSLSSLDGTGKHLPNPEIVLQPLQTREAQLSSQLEGTITDPQQQILFQADPKYPVSDSDPANAYREVFNYRIALRSRLSNSNELPLSLRLIRNLHSTLMDGVRGADQRPGEFRRIQNQIGWPARFVPPPPDYLGESLNAFESYLHSSDAFDPLVRAFLAHYQFEAIHPFRDGNGRVGRLLLSITIAEWCKLSSQWLYMSPYFEKRKRQYMDLLFAVSADGAWENWVRFCLEGVVAQAQDTEKRCDKLVKLHRDFHGRLKAGSVRLSRLVDNLFESPIVTVNQYRSVFGVTYPTARSDLRKLEALGIVKQLERASMITYWSEPIFMVTFEDVESVESA